MTQDKSFFKIYRQPFYALMKNPLTLQVWVFLCAQARFTQAEVDGIEIQPGQLLTTANAIATECCMEQGKVQSILRYLAAEGFIRRENIRNRYTLITVLEPGEQQEAKKEKTAPLTAQQPFAEQAEATPLNEKTGYGIGQNVFLLAEEKRKLSLRTALADIYIDKLSVYKSRTGKEYESDYYVLCEWILQDELNDKRNTAQRTAERGPREKGQAYEPLTADQKLFLPATKASYDLERAEYNALTCVPTETKRKRKGY